VHNPSYIFYGRLPRFPISHKGRLEAGRTARALKQFYISAIYSGPLLRCRQTAVDILKYQRHLTLQKSTLITEVFTPFQGQSAGLVDARNGDVYTGAGPTYEQPEDILNRVQKFLFRTRKKYTGKHVVAVTHGDVILFTMLWANHFPATARHKKKFSTLGILEEYPAASSITTLSYATDEKDEFPSVAYFNPKTHGP
jgi:broad specificity phosphatase PhoE